MGFSNEEDFYDKKNEISTIDSQTDLSDISTNAPKFK